MRNELKTSYRSCNLCEAICGLVIEHDGQDVHSIKGDKEDPLSRGHLCPKALALQDIHADPQRLRRPMRKTDHGFVPISWEEAFDLAEESLQSIRRQYGNDSVGIYVGNPTVHNYGAMVFQHVLKHALGTRNNFTASSLDQRPHHFVANQMFGHGLLIPVPDVDRTDHMIIIGANPAVSNGSLMTAPGIRDRLKLVSERGRVVLIDPRASETSRLVDEHQFIRPGSDVYFLGALLHVIFEKKLTRFDRLGAMVRGVDRLEHAAKLISLEPAAIKTGIPKEVIERIAVNFAEAECAVIYGRLGVSTQEHGALCQWLINALNLVTGNLDREGGHMFTKPAVSLIGRGGTGDQIARWHSRVRGLPEFEGELPTAVMTEEMLTPGDGQIRALVTNAGNPVLSAPNGRQLSNALRGLEFFLAIDLYVNETTCQADLILPPTTGLETEHYDLAFNVLAVRNVAKFSKRTLQPGPQSKDDWEIMLELACRWMPREDRILGKMKRWLTIAAMRKLTPRRLLKLGLMLGPYGIFRRPFGERLNLAKLMKFPHGIDLGTLQPVLPEALRTTDQKINAAPSVLVDELARLANGLNINPDDVSTDPNEFLLIGRRDLRSNNSWMHRSRRLAKGPNRCTLQMHTSDARRLRLRDGELVIASTRVGAIKIPLEVVDSIMPGVISIPHGYGHDRVEREVSDDGIVGVSVNDITDDRLVDSLTGNAAFSGQTVKVERT